jgi:hypothetical protein
MCLTPKRHRAGVFRGRRPLPRPLPSTPHARRIFPLSSSHASGVRTRRGHVQTLPCHSAHQNQRPNPLSSTSNDDGDNIASDDNDDTPLASADKVPTPPSTQRPRDPKTSTKKTSKSSKTRSKESLNPPRSRDHFFNFYSQNIHGMRRSSSNDEGEDSFYKLDQVVNTIKTRKGIH